MQRLGCLQRGLALLTHLPRQTYIPHAFLDDYERELKTRHPNKLMFYLYYIPKYVWYSTKQGSVDLWREIKMHRQINRKPEGERTAFELRHAKRNTADLLKFIPFSLFIIIPAAELLIPPYLFFFPNAIPSTYMFDTAQHKREAQAQEKQAQALAEVLASPIGAQLGSPAEAKALLQKGDFKGVDYQSLSSDELATLCRALGAYYVTGTHILNQTVNIVTYYLPTLLASLLLLPFRARGAPAVDWSRFQMLQNFPLLKFNYQPFEFLKRRLLLAQLHSHLGSVRREDQHLLRNGAADLKPDDLREMLRERGLPVPSSPQDMSRLLQDWAAANADGKLSNQQLIWHSLALARELTRPRQP